MTTAVLAPVSAPVSRPLAGGASRILPPAVGLGALVALWQLLSQLGVIQDFVLPAPTAIASAVVSNWQVLARNGAHTIEEAALGFIIGNASAVLFAVIVVSSRWIRRTVYPAALVARSVPIIAVVPLLILWLGTGMSPRVFIAAVSVFFPTMINTIRGLGAVQAEVDELFETLSASRAQRLMKVRLPTALPYLFSALKIGAAHCVIGAIVAEWLSANVGLGYLIVVSGYEFRVPELWAAVLVAGGVTLGSFGLVSIAERLALPWLREPNGS